MKKIKQKKIILTSVIILLLALFSTYYFFQNSSTTDHNTPSSTIDLDPPSKEEQDQGEKTKLENTENIQEPTKDSGGSVLITSLSQDPNTKDVIVQTKLMDSTWSDCTLKLESNNQVITKTADVLFNKEFSTCMGFVVDSDELNNSSVWKVSLTAKNSDGKIISSDEQQIDIVR